MHNLQQQIADLQPVNPINALHWLPIDLTEKGVKDKGISLENIESAEAWFHAHVKTDTVYYGGYFEKRNWYGRNANFVAAAETRNIHLGTDIWAKAGTQLVCPLDATIHSFANNQATGDYGYTIVLEHNINNTPLYSLYGHLSSAGFSNLSVGQKIKKGTPFAEIGAWNENGNWPPHVHMQLMTDMLGKQGDFLGVCFEKDIEKYQALCPNPKWFIPAIK